jgi:hypothetical protein
MIVAQILQPASKLGTARALQEETATTSLPHELALGSVDDEELYGALDWLLKNQTRIETKQRGCSARGTNVPVSSDPDRAR